MARLAERVVLLLLAVVVVGCGDKSAVALTAKIGSASLAVEQLTLGTRLTGSFDLFLELGPAAPGSTTVTLDAFALLRASDGSTLIQPLVVLPQNAELPLTLGPGKRKTIVLRLDDSKLVAAELRDEICAGPVFIKGAVSDTASDEKVTPVDSAEITPSGC